MYESGWYKGHDLLTVLSPVLLGHLQLYRQMMWNLSVCMISRCGFCSCAQLMGAISLSPENPTGPASCGKTGKLSPLQPLSSLVSTSLGFHNLSGALGSQASDCSSPEVPNYFQTSFQRANVFLARGAYLCQKYGESRRRYDLPWGNQKYSNGKLPMRVLPTKTSISSGFRLQCLIARGYYTCPDQFIRVLWSTGLGRWTDKRLNANAQRLRNQQWIPTNA